MVSEAIADAPATAPADTAAPITTPQSDAAPSAPDAAAPATPDEAEASVQAFLGKSKEGKSAEGKEAAGGDGKEAVADEVDPLIRDAQEKAAKATEERVARETAERIEREAAEAAEAQRKAALQTAFENRYAERMQNAGTKLEERLVGLGMNPALAHEIAQEQAQAFNSHHADGLQLYEPEALKTANASLTGRINDTLREVLGRDADKFFGTGEDEKRYDLKGHYEALKSLWTDGLVTPAEAEAQTALALVRYHRELQEANRIVGAKTPQSTDGSSSNGGASLNFRTKTEARNAHARGEIKNDQMRAINANPNIPEI